MYETAMLKPFRLKTTNGDKLAYYGNCHINITSRPFDNIKNRNKSDTPFKLTSYDEYAPIQKQTKLKTTTHVLALNHDTVWTEDPPYTQLTSPDDSYNSVQRIIQQIPDLNDDLTLNNFNNFLRSIKDRQLKNTITQLLYNITHGETPYSNTDYQKAKMANTFVLFCAAKDMLLNRWALPYPTGFNNYPHNSLIFIGQAWENGQIHYPLFFYRKNTECKRMDFASESNNMPSYGITVDSYGTSYIYWTTYKGV